jgi:hypothetical protein
MSATFGKKTRQRGRMTTKVIRIAASGHWIGDIVLVGANRVRTRAVTVPGDVVLKVLARLTRFEETEGVVPGGAKDGREFQWFVVGQESTSETEPETEPELVLVGAA